jgi:hypothetical protein
MNSPDTFLESFARYLERGFSREFYLYAGYTGGTGALLIRDNSSKTLLVFKPWLRTGPVGLQDVLGTTDRYGTVRGKNPDIIIHVAGTFRGNAIDYALRHESVVLIALDLVARELVIHGKQDLPTTLISAVDSFCRAMDLKKSGDIHSTTQLHRSYTVPAEVSSPVVAAPNAPTLFVSYAWESEQHRVWVLKLAADLIRSGVDVRIDEWDLCHYGHDLHRFMETCVRESDYVVLVCTPEYAKRANDRRGGVGVESTIITGEYYMQEKGNKFIPILRSDAGVQRSLPSYVASRFAIDFSRDSEYQMRLEELLRRLYNQPRFVRPSLGSRPPLQSEEL